MTKFLVWAERALKGQSIKSIESIESIERSIHFEVEEMIEKFFTNYDDILHGSEFPLFPL